MYMPNIEKFGEVLKKSLQNNREVNLLYKDKDKNTDVEVFYELKEYICYLKEMRVSNFKTKSNKEMYELELLFADGQNLTTVACLDKQISDNAIISIVGYIDNFNGKLQFYTRGGVEMVYTTIEDMVKSGFEYDFKRTNRLGLPLGLSIAAESKKYYETNNIFPLENTKLFYIEKEYKNNYSLSDIQKEVLRKVYSSDKQDKGEISDEDYMSEIEE